MPNPARHFGRRLAPIRVAAINFLNPAPLMWDLEHGPCGVERRPGALEHLHSAADLWLSYALHYMHPSQCAADLLAGRADLGLVPIATLTPGLAIVPGSAIAALDRVRSIQLIVRGERALKDVRDVAADIASRSSVAYAEVLFKSFLAVSPRFVPCPADPVAMLNSADAALLIGDSALLALEARESIEDQLGRCQWFDLAHEWHERTGLPWLAAVWAVRSDAIASETLDTDRLVEDLNQSRIHGLAHIEDIVAEWTPRIAIPAVTIRAYLTGNIHYSLDEGCIETLRVFRRYAAETGVLPPLPQPLFL